MGNSSQPKDTTMTPESILREIDLLAKEGALLKKEAELITRDSELNIRESTINKQEIMLTSRISALVNAENSQTFTVVYLSKYSGENLECEKIGDFTDDKSAIIGVVNWLIQTGNGGFDEGTINETLDDMALDNDEMSDYTGELKGEELSHYLTKKCETWNDLRNICANYGNSWFEDIDGWHLKKI